MNLVAACAAAACALTLVACGGARVAQKTATQTVSLAAVNPLAVTKMVQGVRETREPGGRDRGVALLREAIALDHNLWEARFDLGVLLADGGALGEAEGELAVASRLAPESPDVAFALGEVRRRRGNHKAAADGLGEFLRQAPASAARAGDVRSLYIASLRDAGLLDRALAEAREALLRKPADAAALAELALCHLAKGEKEAAQLIARQALDANPRSAVAHRVTGVIALANGDDAVAFQALSRASQEDPKDTTARLDMGAVLLRAGAYGRAEEQYRAALNVAADDVGASIGLAAALRGLGKLEEARVLLEKGLEREPHNVSALFNMGVLTADFLKKPEIARGYFQRFLADAPEGHPAKESAERYLASGGTK